MRPSFDQTVSVLVKAYLNDTLVHGFCSACAVGNLVAESMGFSMRKEPGMRAPQWNEANPRWDFVFSCSGDVIGRDDFQEINPDVYLRDVAAREQIDSTGYHWAELARIELAFESVPRIGSTEDRMFAGLMAVVDVLASIHNVDLSTKEQAKLLFVK